MAVCEIAWAGEQTDAALRAELEAMLVGDQAQRMEMRSNEAKYEIGSPEFRALWDKRHAGR